MHTALPTPRSTRLYTVSSPPSPPVVSPSRPPLEGGEEGVCELPPLPPHRLTVPPVPHWKAGKKGS